MKKVEIRKFSHAEVDEPSETFGFLKIPAKHELIRAEGEDLKVSDGYHTFDELYQHRYCLFIALCKKVADEFDKEDHGLLAYRVWRSKLHADGTMFDDMFILGIDKKKGEQITYHLPIDLWHECSFAQNLKNAPEWDGHTPSDVLDRLMSL